MSLGPLMLDVHGLTLSAEDRELLVHPLVGGVILFARNFESREQLCALTGELHALRDPRLIIAVDQEGGKVQRFRDGFSRIPPMQRLGQLYDSDPQAARELAAETGWLLAAELLASGVDLSFAPVLDLGRGVSSVIGDRALHADPQAVVQLGSALMRGMVQAGMAATAKHFPGHGGVREDSHHELPVDKRTLQTLESNDLVPFKHVIRNGIAAIMTAHVVYPEVDTRPVTFSSRWLQEVLRGQLGFTGAIVSDDLSMQGAAAAGDIVQRTLEALTVGVDLALICNDREASLRVVDELQFDSAPESSLRRVRLHGRAQASWEELSALDDCQRVRDALQRLDDAPELDL